MRGKGSWMTEGEKKVGRVFEKQGLAVLYQYQLGPYKLDIFLPQIKTNIEVHGPHHVISSRMKRDKDRTRYIKGRGYSQYIIHAQDANNQAELREFAKRVLDDNPRVNSSRPDIFNDTCRYNCGNFYSI
jgi:very-short-patch-repair endonuclease